MKMGVGLLYITDKAQQGVYYEEVTQPLMLTLNRAGLNFTTYVFTLVNGVRKITKSGVA